MRRCSGPAGTAAVVAAAAIALPRVCAAEAYGGQLSADAYFVIGAIAGLPSAIACLIGEAVRPRTRIPAWLMVAAAVVAIVAIGCGLPARFHDTARVLAWTIVPPGAVVALRGAVTRAAPRLAIGWFVAALVLGLVVARNAEPGIAALLLGGAGTCLLVWTVTLAVLIALRVEPAHAQVAAGRSTLRRAAAALDDAERRLGRHFADLPPVGAGWLWWLAGAAAIYFAVAASIATGLLDGGQWIDVELARVIDFFGLAAPRDYRPLHVWWTFGLPWSLLAGGAVWGIAATAGRFDAGRLRHLRLAAMTVGIALIAWSVTLAIESAQVRAREEQASGLHR